MHKRKATKNTKARVTLTEKDILDACYFYLQSKGYKTGDLSYIVMPVPAVKTPRRKQVKVIVEIDKFPEAAYDPAGLFSIKPEDQTK
jgi:hypothetical protein